MFGKDIRMNKPFLQPFYISYVNGNCEEIDDELVFAGSETDAIRKILMTYEDTKFVYQTQSASELLNTTHA